MAKVAVLGMGAMGARMAAALLKSGHAVTVWNRSSERTAPLAEAGARVADTPRTAVQEAEFAIAMVRDDAASEAVWLHPDTGALAGLAADAVAIESSTLTVAWIKTLAEHCHSRQVALLDAPVSGSRPQAEAGQLIYLVGGEAAAVARAEPILRAMGSAVYHAGTAGSGAALKLAVNTLYAVQVATLAEWLGLLQRSGIEGAKAVEIISATPICAPALKGAASGMVAGQFAPLFPVELVEKDLDYALAAAKNQGASLTMAEAASRLFAQANACGYGAENLTAVVRLCSR